MLITGPEGVLAERALASVVAAAREADPEAEKITVRATAYEPGVLAMHASPSLFGGSKVIVAEDVDEASDDLVTDLLHYIAAPAPDLMLANPRERLSNGCIVGQDHWLCRHNSAR